MDLLMLKMYSAILCMVVLSFFPYSYGASDTAADDASANRKPNIVFVFADDLGWSDIGYHSSQIKTPNLDQLANSGVKLENYYVQPICTPTRSQFLTGRYQIHTGLQHDIIWPETPSGLPLDSPTLADKLRQSGYSTHLVGKWHLGFYKDEYLPWNRGFDSFYGILLGSGDHFNHTKPFKFTGTPYLDLRDNEKVVYDNEEYSTHLYTRKATEIIKNHDKEKPLFLYLAHQAVHVPMQVPESYLQQYRHFPHHERMIYAGMTSALDEGIGNVTQALRDEGMWDNTIFVFSSDNGGLPETHYGYNYPLRGYKRTLWEGGIRAVGFVAGGKLSAQGTINKELIHVSDWFPTFVNLAGGHFDDTKPLDGMDQWNTINSGEKSPRDTILHNIDPLYHQPGNPLFTDTFDTRIRGAIRVGHLKLITGDPGLGECVVPPEETQKHCAVPLITDGQPTGKNVWLFNITADPNEDNDLSDERPDDVRVLLAKLEEYRRGAAPVNYPARTPDANPALRGGVWGPWVNSAPSTYNRDTFLFSIGTVMEIIFFLICIF